jgi:hypothetical protein
MKPLQLPTLVLKSIALPLSRRYSIVEIIDVPKEFIFKTNDPLPIADFNDQLLSYPKRTLVVPTVNEAIGLYASRSFPTMNGKSLVLPPIQVIAFITLDLTINFRGRVIVLITPLVC